MTTPDPFLKINELLDVVQRRILKQEGKLESFLVKSQSDDKKLEKIDGFKNSLDESHREVSECMSMLNQTAKIVNSRMGDMSGKIENHDHQLNILMIKSPLLDVVKNLCDENKAKVENQSSQIDSLAFKNNTYSDMLKRYDHKLNEIENAFQVFTSAALDKFNFIVSKEDWAKEKSELDSKNKQKMDVLAETLNEQSKCIEYMKEKMSKSLADLNAAHSSNLRDMDIGFSTLRDNLLKKIEEFKPISHKEEIQRLNAGIDSIKNTLNSKKDKEGIVDSQIEIMERKLEKLFIILKKLELARE